MNEQHGRRLLGKRRGEKTGGKRRCVIGEKNQEWTRVLQVDDFYSNMMTCYHHGSLGRGGSQFKTTYSVI